VPGGRPASFHQPRCCQSKKSAQSKSRAYADPRTPLTAGPTRASASSTVPNGAVCASSAFTWRVTGDTGPNRGTGRPHNIKYTTFDVCLFYLLAFFALWGLIVFFAPPSSEVGKMSAAMMVILVWPVAVVAMLIAVIRYRLWRERLFGGLLLLSGSAAIWVGIRIAAAHGLPVKTVHAVALALVLLVTIPLWQVVGFLRHSQLTATK